MNERAGKYVKNFSKESEYLSFYPRPLPPEPEIETDAELRDLLIDAHSKLALRSAVFPRRFGTLFHVCRSAMSICGITAGTDAL